MELTNIIIPNFKIISDSSYFELVRYKDEYIVLQLRLQELVRNEDKYKEMLKANELTIEQLKEENNILRKRISDLETQVSSQNNAIDILMKDKAKRDEKEKYNKILIAIQDVNSLDWIENKLSGNHKKNLNTLRADRVSDCHYINVSLDDTDKNNRRTVLHEKLVNMEQNLRRKFDKNYPGLFDELLKYIAPIKNTLTPEIREEIDEWWD